MMPSSVAPPSVVLGYMAASGNFLAKEQLPDVAGHMAASGNSQLRNGCQTLLDTWRLLATPQPRIGCRTLLYGCRECCQFGQNFNE